MIGKELASALVALQADLVPVKKTAVNPFFKNAFAPLPEVMEALQPLLAKHKLAVLNQMDNLNGETALRTIVVHESGESIEAITPLLLAKDDPQGQGSAVTYARRYATMAVLGMVADDDDDGNKATSSYQASPARSAKPRYATMKQVELMINKVKWGLNIQDKDQILNFLDQVLDTELTKITADSVDDALAKIDEAVRKEKVGNKVDQTAPPADIIVEIPEGEFSLDGVPY